MLSKSVHRKIHRRKMRWPTGAPFDQILDWLEAWNRLHYRPRFVFPRTYNELILASKHRFRGDIALARRVTDKVGFKEWLKETPEWRRLIVPTLEAFDSAQELEGKVFQPGTILKPTHLSGPVLIFDEARTLTSGKMEKVEDWLKRDYYRGKREPTYKGIGKRLILEPLLRDETGGLPKDFKFHMVNGRPLMIQVDMDRFGQHTKQFYSPEWNLLDFTQLHPQNPKPRPRPAQLEEALQVASELARPFPLCRVDLYLLPGKGKNGGAIKAGELTFFHNAGCEPFVPPEADRELGRRARELLKERAK